MEKILLAIFILLNSFCFVTAQNNSKSLIAEKIYLHTDKEIYISGEYLFYTLYLQGSRDAISKYAYLIIRDKNNSFVSNVRLEINNQTAYGNIYLPDTLSSAIYQIVCYTNYMRNESEQAYFNKEIVIGNRFDEKMDLFNGSVRVAFSDSSLGRKAGIANMNKKLLIHLDKKVFNQREKISFSIESDNLPDDSITRLSASISEIVSGISSEPSISEYFGNDNKRSYESKSNQNHCSFIPEISGSVIQGKVLPVTESGKGQDSIKINSTNALKNYTLLVSTADSIANMQFTTTDSLGLFNIHLNPYYEGKDLFVRIKENIKANIETDNKFGLIQSFNPSDRFNVPEIKSYLLRNGKIAQIRKFYNEQVEVIKKMEFHSGKIIPRIYFSHYSTVYPSDFIELPDLVEIIRETSPVLKVRKVGDKFVSGYINFQENGHINLEPAIFLDGVPIDDINQIINLGTKKIKRLEILPSTRFYGRMSFSGILTVFTKDMLIDNIQFKTPSIKYHALSSQSYTKPKPFKPIDNSSHIPDLRQVLLWEPEIILKKNERQQLECYASDLTGQFRINIQGITSKGERVTGSAIISVQAKF